MNVGPRFENLSKLISELIERNTQADSQRAEWSELMTSSALAPNGEPQVTWLTTSLSLGAVISRKTLDTQTV